MIFKKLAIAIATAALVSACSGLELQNAKTVAPAGDAFSKALYSEYVKLSTDEYNEGDYTDSDLFATRAIAAAGGKPTEPEEVASRKQTAGAAKALGEARARLVKAFAGGAKGRKPADAANAQAMYECWAQEQEENFQPDHIDACRIGFFIALAKIEQAPAAPTPPPAPAAKASPLNFLVYFGFNSAQIDAKARNAIATATKVIKESKPSVVSVIGHTDKSGTSSYNSQLAEKRANAVAEMLGKNGVPGNLMTIGSLGENAPAVPTPDGAKESGNRRVEITVRY